MRTIGVLGGIGPQATMDFEQRVHRIAQQINPQQPRECYPPLLVYYHRSAPMVTENGRASLPIQPDPHLLAAAHRMGTWADFLVIVSNGAHMLQKSIEQAAGRPVVSMIEATVAEVQRRGLRHVGVLGLFEPRVYYAPLERIGVAYETISGELQQRLDQAIFAVMDGRAAETHAVARAAIAELRARDVEAIILGCTEIPFMLPEWEADSSLINPTELLAQAAMRAAIM